MSDSVVPVFDGHNDMLLRLAAGGAFFEQDAQGHLDLPRARTGGLAGGFCTVFVRSAGLESAPLCTAVGVEGEPVFPLTPSFPEANSSAVGAMARLFRLERDSHGDVKIVRSAQEIEECIRDGFFAALLHLEGAESIDPEFDTLELFHRAGLRSLGLTDLGRKLVFECNRIRILIDISVSGARRRRAYSQDP